jgi:hypothetical protein
VAAHLQGTHAEAGVFGDASVTGKRVRAGAQPRVQELARRPKKPRGRAAPAAVEPAGESDSAAESDAAPDEGSNDEGIASDESGSSARAAPQARAARGPAFEGHVTVLPEELTLNVLWRDYADAVTEGKKSATTKKDNFFSTLQSIIDQYEDMDGCEKQVAAFIAAQSELKAVVVPATVRVDAVIRTHMASQGL